MVIRGLHSHLILPVQRDQLYLGQYWQILVLCFLTVFSGRLKARCSRTSFFLPLFFFFSVSTLKLPCCDWSVLGFTTITGTDSILPASLIWNYHGPLNRLTNLFNLSSKIIKLQLWKDLCSFLKSIRQITKYITWNYLK